MVSSVPCAHLLDVGRREVFVQLDDGGLPEGLHELEVDLRRQDETLRLRRHAYEPVFKCLLDFRTPVLLQAKGLFFALSMFKRTTALAERGILLTRS